MTEKRFVGGPGGFYDRYKGDRWLWNEWEDIIEIMNNLDTKARERSKALSKLQKENEQLKSKNIELKLQLDICEKPLFSKRQLHEENQLLASKEEIYLKPVIQSIEEAYENERTALGKSILKQLLEKIE